MIFDHRDSFEMSETLVSGPHMCVNVEGIVE
jgi:hypothetical protein